MPATEAPLEPADPTPFRLVAKGTFRLVPLHDRVWLRDGEDGLAFAELRGDAFVRDETLARGVESCVPDMQRWVFFDAGPSLYLLRDFEAWGRASEPGRLFRWAPDGWYPVRTVKARWFDAGPWTAGSLLMAEIPADRGPPWHYELRTLDGGVAPVPRRSPHHADGGCDTDLELPLRLFSDSRGTAVVVGAQRCSAGHDHGPAVAERFQPGKPSSIETLPVSLVVGATVLGTGPDDVWLVGADAKGRPALVSGTAKGFAIAQVLEPDTVLVGLGSSGATYLRTGADLFRRDASGHLTPIPLPRDAGPVLDVHETAEGDVWLVTDVALYRTRAMARYAPARVKCVDDGR
jgi:hypothetical protein